MNSNLICFGLGKKSRGKECLGLVSEGSGPFIFICSVVGVFLFKFCCFGLVFLGQGTSDRFRNGWIYGLFFPFILDKLCQSNVSVFKIVWIERIILWDFFSLPLLRTELLFYVVFEYTYWTQLIVIILNTAGLTSFDCNICSLRSLLLGE